MDVALEPLYSINVVCCNCEHQFSTSRVRPSFKKAVRTDADFCAYYNNENPDYYVVRVCPKCGFASTEHSTERLSDMQKKQFAEKIGKRWIERDYSGHRDWEIALETYKLALLCAQTIGEKDRIIASLLHHIAWLYRYKGDEEQEQRFLKYCLDSYIRVYELEAYYCRGRTGCILLSIFRDTYRSGGNGVLLSFAGKWPDGAPIPSIPLGSARWRLI